MFRNGAVVALSVLVFGVAALIPHSCLAQSQDQSVPNLSGTWELVEDDNDAVELKPTHAGFPRLTLVNLAGRITDQDYAQADQARNRNRAGVFLLHGWPRRDKPGTCRTMAELRGQIRVREWMAKGKVASQIQHGTPQVDW